VPPAPPEPATAGAARLGDGFRARAGRSSDMGRGGGVTGAFDRDAGLGFALGFTRPRSGPARLVRASDADLDGGLFDGPFDNPCAAPRTGPLDGPFDGPLDCPLDGPFDGPLDGPFDGPFDGPLDRRSSRVTPRRRTGPPPGVRSPAHRRAATLRGGEGRTARGTATWCRTTTGGRSLRCVRRCRSGRARAAI